jgi:hypothetical protein
MNLHFMTDAQAVLGFMVRQASVIEAEVYRTKYPDIQYPGLIPVDTSANEWAKSITFFSIDQVGKADWFHHGSHDMRLADIQRSKFEKGIELAGIGYRYTLEELGQAMMIPGLNLTTERADAARRAYEEFLDQVAFFGDTQKNWTGLVNDATATRADAIADGTGATRTWSTKTGDQIVRDVNSVLTGIYTASLTTEMADTILLPIDRYTLIANTRLDTSGGQVSILEWLAKYNVASSQTGVPLTIRAVRNLDTAGATSTARMVAYRRDPSVVKLHLPMPHRFLQVWQTGPLVFDVPGIFRTGGVEVRRPGAVRYLDGI